VVGAIYHRSVTVDSSGGGAEMDEGDNAAEHA
jgi:hypothetical protein